MAIYGHHGSNKHLLQQVVVYPTQTLLVLKANSGFAVPGAFGISGICYLELLV